MPVKRQIEEPKLLWTDTTRIGDLSVTCWSLLCDHAAIIGTACALGWLPCFRAAPCRKGLVGALTYIGVGKSGFQSKPLES